MRVLIVSLLFISLAGCVSAPYRDDYTAHINNISDHYDERDIRFVLVEGSSTDIRGVYSQDDTAAASPILYQGGAGLAGVIAQIGTHVTIINSQRNTKLAEAQVAANAEIAPLISAAKEIDLVALVDQSKVVLLEPDKAANAPDAVNIKPIFFASGAMDKVSLNMIVWIDENGQSEGTKPRYQNLIQVFSPRLDEPQRKRLAEGDKALLSNLLASLLNTSLAITKSDLMGKYVNNQTPEKTYLVEKHFGEKVVRGAVVDNTCEYVVIRDIRSWFVAYSKENTLASIEKPLTDECGALAKKAASS